MLENSRPIRVAATSLRQWVSGGATPTVAWIRDGSQSSGFRWQSALIVAGAAVGGIILARAILANWEARNAGRGGSGRSGGGTDKENIGKSMDSAGRSDDGSQEDWDIVQSESTRQNPLEASAFMVPGGTSPSVNLAASVVFVGGEDDEGVDNDAQGSKKESNSSWWPFSRRGNNYG